MRIPESPSLHISTFLVWFFGIMLFAFVLLACRGLPHTSSRPSRRPRGTVKTRAEEIDP